MKLLTNPGPGARAIVLNYSIGGNELVYTGLDGDEFHTKAHWDGESLVFDIVEHERGREIVSKQTWKLTDDGRVLQEVRQVQRDGAPAKSVAVFEKMQDGPK